MAEELMYLYSEYVFGSLFVVLFMYEIYTSGRREDRLMNHAEKLQMAYQETAETMKLLKSETKKELADIKELIKNGRL